MYTHLVTRLMIVQCISYEIILLLLFLCFKIIKINYIYETHYSNGMMYSNILYLYKQ